MSLNYLPSFMDLVYVGSGIVGSIWIPLYLVRRADKKANKEAKKAEAKEAKIAADKKIVDDKAEIERLAEIEKAKALELAVIKNAITAVVKDVGDIKKQFGDNGGGLRELVNVMRNTQVAEVKKSEVISGIAHEMRGQLTEHIRQHGGS